jgi:hypothetical protein
MRIVNTHVLINGFASTKDADDKQFIRNDLSGVTKEEFDYFIKFRDFERVKQYETVIHSTAMDVPVYGRIYFKREDGAYKLDNNLKLQPFSLDPGNPEYKPSKLKTTAQLFDYDLENYFIPGANKDLISNIKLVIMSRFDLSPVWRVDLLIDSIRKAYVFPSLENVPESDIKLHIFNRRNVHVVDDYVCYLKNTESK